jgi:hypothetical protein
MALQISTTAKSAQWMTIPRARYGMYSTYTVQSTSSCFQMTLPRGSNTTTRWKVMKLVQLISYLLESSLMVNFRQQLIE